MVLLCRSLRSKVNSEQVNFRVLRVLKPGGRFLFIEHVAAPWGTGHVRDGHGPNTHRQSADSRRDHGPLIEQSVITDLERANVHDSTLLRPFRLGIALARENISTPTLVFNLGVPLALGDILDPKASCFEASSDVVW